ncbi:MAG: replicative DNA helicase [Planctomycetota bacterium]
MSRELKSNATGQKSAGPGPAFDKGLAARAMPQSLSAEAAVIGSMIVDTQCIGDVVEKLNADAFYHVEHQLMYEAMVRLYEKNRGDGLDALLLRDELEKKKHLKDVGGADYIVRVAESVPSSANVMYYADIVKDRQLLREIILATTDILNDAYDQQGLTSEKLDSAEQKIFAITNKNITGSAVALNELVTQAFTLIEQREGKHFTGLETGYFELDEMTCGLQKGEMIIIAGRPSMGKTSLALNMAEHMGMACKTSVAIFSLEMGKQQLAERFLCSRSQIESQLVRKGMLGTEHYEQLVKACGELSDTPIYVDDTAGLTPLMLRAKARRLKSQHDIQCVIIDYLQLMNIGTGRVESRQQEITAISRYLKALARELDVPVIVLSQLNRAAENREGHRPRMSDLRESGSIEQDADVVMLLHREDYYHRGEEGYENNNTAELIIAKQRNGPTGMVPLRFREKLTRFENASFEEEPF